MTTFGAMQTRIAKELGDPDNSRWASDIKQHIVDAVTFYQSERFWFVQDRAVQASDVTSSTVDGTEYYAYPTSPALVTLDSLRILANSTSPFQLILEHWETIEQLAVPGSVAKGVPTLFAKRGEQVRIYPIPDDAYTLYWAGVFKPTEITVDSDANATNAWMTHGARLIRNAAKKSMARDLLHDGVRGAAAEVAEMEALDQMRGETTRRLKVGRVRPVGPGTVRQRYRT